MKTIAIISQKGGAGKTTVAIHLAVAAERAGLNAALFDLDPQASAASWADKRNAFDMVVMHWGDRSRVPNSGKKLIIAGIANDGLLNIRIFDAAGKLVADSVETERRAKRHAVRSEKTRTARAKRHALQCRLPLERKDTHCNVAFR